MFRGDRLKELRTERGMSMRDLAEICETSKSAIGMYEKGERRPKYETMEAIADTFNVDIDYLLGKSDIRNRFTHSLGGYSLATSVLKDIESKRGVKIPVFGNVAAGIPIDAITDIEDYEEITEELAASGEYVALKIKGDSMEPKMSQGDVVIVRVQPTIESGEIAIVLINGDNATCKKVKKTEEGIMLISLNSAYEPMFYSNKQIEELPIRIFGKVVELRAKF